MIRYGKTLRMTLFFPKSYLQGIWPWTATVERILRNAQSQAFSGTHLAIASDYSGDHKGSHFHTHCYLIVDTDRSYEWPHLREQVRRNFLPDGRRMSFKALGDHHRQRAIVPFLRSADTMHGHLVGLIVNKRLSKLAYRSAFDATASQQLGLRGAWKEPAFEAMFRHALMFALMLSVWSRPFADVTWISDQDDTTANELRLDDVQQLAAKLSSQFVPHRMGVFAFNSTAIDAADRYFEDFVAIPDLAAGMLSELSNSLVRSEELEAYSIAPSRPLSAKCELISDWFWWDKATLRRTCILIDSAGPAQFSVQKLTSL